MIFLVEFLSLKIQIRTYLCTLEIYEKGLQYPENFKTCHHLNAGPISFGAFNTV